MTAKDCERLRDHMVALRMASVTADHDQHRAAIRAALGDFVTTCPEALSVDQLHCSLGAKDFQVLAACDPASATAPASGVAP